jgi:hypothetical protein
MTDDDLGFDASNFEPGDTELARRLGSVAPPAGDADAVLAGMRPRLTRARRRRQAGAVAIGAAALVLLAGVAFAATDPGTSSKVRVPPATRPPATVVTVPTPTTPMTPTVPLTNPDGRVASPTTPAPAPGTGAPPPATAPTTPPTTIDDHGGNRGPGSTSPNSGPGSGSSGSGSSGSG